MEGKHVFKAFLYFYKLKYNETLPYSQRNKDLCQDFINALVLKYNHIESIGIEYIWIYMVFQYDYWNRLEIEKRNKKIDISYIIGKKAFERFVSRDIQFDWQISENARTYSKKDFELVVNLPNSINSDHKYDADDIYRAQHLNAEIGLSNCITFTSLFNPNSKNCQLCNLKQQCMDAQQQLYPQIYRNRKIENGSQQTTTG